MTPLPPISAVLPGHDSVQRLGAGGFAFGCADGGSAPMLHVAVALTQSAEESARMDAAEWDEILGHSDCLEYVSPDIEQCMPAHRDLEAEHELELTGREFLASPTIPAILLRSKSPMMCRAPGRPGLRQRLPRPSYVTKATREVQELISKPQQARRTRQVRQRQDDRSREIKQEQPVDVSFDGENLAPNLLLEQEGELKYAAQLSRLSLDTEISRLKILDRRFCETERKSKDCKVPGCSKGARSRGLCKRHGGGKRCTYAGCTRSDQGGGFCIAHGGGKRCSIEGCKNSSQSRGLCKTHGGGKRCVVDDCPRSSQERGMCRTHASHYKF